MKRLLYFILLLFCASSCDKHKQKYYALRVECFIPYSKKPVKGLKYTINETRYKDHFVGYGLSYKTNWTLSGQVGIDGITETFFSRNQSPTTSYIADFDYSHLDASVQGYDIIKSLDYSGSSLDENHTKIVRMYFLAKMTVNLHYKNVNCTGPNDVFKFKSKNIDEYLELNNWENEYNWINLNGCTDETHSNSNQHAGRYVYVWELTRGGITTTGIDTFLVSPETTNTINMFW